MGTAQGTSPSGDGSKDVDDGPVEPGPIATKAYWFHVHVMAPRSDRPGWGGLDRVGLGLGGGREVGGDICEWRLKIGH